MSGLTKAHKAALKWFHDHGGDGMFDRASGHTVLAAGEISPVMRRTWNLLRDAGYVEVYGPKLRRVRLTYAGRDLVGKMAE